MGREADHLGPHDAETLVPLERAMQLAVAIEHFGQWLDLELVKLVERHARRGPDGKIIEPRPGRFGRNF